MNKVAPASTGGTAKAQLKERRVAMGAVAEAKKFLKLQGTSRFGEPDARVSAALDAIHDLEELEALGVRLLTAGGWHDLLGLPAARAPRRRKADS